MRLVTRLIGRLHMLSRVSFGRGMDLRKGGVPFELGSTPIGLILVLHIFSNAGFG